MTQNTGWRGCPPALGSLPYERAELGLEQVELTDYGPTGAAVHSRQAMQIR